MAHRPEFREFSAIYDWKATLPGSRYNESMSEQAAPSTNFEASLEELERIVKELEKGDLPLEQSLTLFEKGMAISAACKQQLELAETRVEMLTRRGSQIVPVPFDPEKNV
jgi:exodeoxyribonuclease VII small subunit